MFSAPERSRVASLPRSLGVFSAAARRIFASSVIMGAPYWSEGSLRGGTSRCSRSQHTAADCGAGYSCNSPDGGRTVYLVYTGPRQFQAGQPVRVHVSDGGVFIL